MKSSCNAKNLNKSWGMTKKERGVKVYLSSNQNHWLWDSQDASSNTYPVGACCVFLHHQEPRSSHPFSLESQTSLWTTENGIKFSSNTHNWCNCHIPLTSCRVSRKVRKNECLVFLFTYAANLSPKPFHRFSIFHLTAVCPICACHSSTPGSCMIRLFSSFFGDLDMRTLIFRI